MRTLLAVAVLSAACATGARQQVAAKDVPYSSEGQAKPKGVMRCHVERDTGSNYAERICQYEDANPQPGDTTIDDALIQAQRRAAQHEGPAYAPTAPPARAGGGK